MAINFANFLFFVYLLSEGLSEGDQLSPKIPVELNPQVDFWKSHVSGIRSASLVYQNQSTNFFFFVDDNDDVKSDGTLSYCPAVGKGLDESCQYRKDCRNVPYSFCSNGKCSCKPDYFARDGKCFGLLRKNCEEDLDCGVSNSSCKSGICECMTNFYSINDSKCYKFAEVPGEECGTTEGCQGVKYSTCSEGKCSCISNYFPKEEKCRGLLREACDDDFDCGVPNSSCESRYCGCMTNFYSTNTSKCIPFAKVPGDVCGSDRGCRNVKYSMCLQEKCSCKENYIAKDGKCSGLLKEACEGDSDCVVANSSCQSGFCSCMRDFYSTDTSKCHRYAKVRGDKCASNNGCRNIKYSVCLHGKCICKRNYFGKDGKCSGILKEVCEGDSDCVVANSSCESGFCGCMTGFYSTNTSKCLSFAKVPGDVCGSDRGCKNVKYSTCSENQCQCSSNYRLQNNSCLGLIDATCFGDQDCAVKNSVCHENSCKCIYGYYSDDACYRYIDTLDEHCDEFNLCEVPYSTCSDGKCKCPSKYIGFNNVCYGREYAYCSSPSDCLSTSFSCESGICKNVETKEDDKWISSKPEVSSYWYTANAKKFNPTDGIFAGMDGDTEVSVCRQVLPGVTVPGKLLKPKQGAIVCSFSYFDTERRMTPYFQKLSGSNVEWKDSSYTLDRAIYGGSDVDKKPYLICRTKHTRGANQTLVGRLNPPLYNSCISPYDSKVYNYDKFDVLVHK